MAPTAVSYTHLDVYKRQDHLSLVYGLYGMLCRDKAHPKTRFLYFGRELY